MSLPVQIFGQLFQEGINNKKSATSTSISSPPSSLCEPIVHIFDSDRSSVRSDESQKQIMKPTGDALEAIVAKSEIRRSEEIVFAAASSAQATAAVVKDFDLNSVEIIDVELDDQRLVPCGESFKQIKQAVEDALFAESEFFRAQRIWSQLHFNETAGQGSDSKAVVVSAAVSLAQTAAAVAMASSNAATCAKSVVDAVLNSSDTVSEAEAVSNNGGTGSADLNLLFKEAKLAKKNLSDMLAILAMGEPNILKPSNLVQSGAVEFGEELGITSATLAKPTNTTEAREFSLVEAAVSSEKQGKFSSLETDTEGKGGRNCKAVGNLREYHQIRSERSPTTRPSDTQNKNGELNNLQETSLLPTSHKRKPSLTTKDDDTNGNPNIVDSVERSDMNQVEDLVRNTNPENLVSHAAEPRRSSRKGQPSLKILDGYETYFLSVGKKTRPRSNSSKGASGSSGTNGSRSKSM